MDIKLIGEIRAQRITGYLNFLENNKKKLKVKKATNGTKKTKKKKTIDDNTLKALMEQMGIKSID